MCDYTTGLGINLREDFELLETLLVELDLLEEGFAGVLVEVYHRRDRYVLLETTPATGHRLLRFSSKDREAVYAALARELGGPSGWYRSALACPPSSPAGPEEGSRRRWRRPRGRYLGQGFL